MAADVAGGESQGAQAGNLQVGKILTYTAAVTEDLRHGSGDGGRRGIKLEVPEDPLREFLRRIHDRSSRHEGLQGIIQNLRTGFHQGGIIGVLHGLEGAGTAVGENLSAH